MKTCTRCKEHKDEDSFHKNRLRPDGLQDACKRCMTVSYTSSRHKKIDHYKRVQKVRRDAGRVKYHEWKSKQVCSFCPESHECCLELHHLDPSIKEAAISRVISTWSWSKILKEIEKCVVVCANCHRKVHAGIILIVP